MPEPRGPQYGEKIPSAGEAKPASNIDQETPKPSQARPEDKVRYASSQRQEEDQDDIEGVDAAEEVTGAEAVRDAEDIAQTAKDERSQQNRGPDQRTQLGQHQDRQAQPGQGSNKESQEATTPGRDRYDDPDKRAQEKEDHQGEREGLENEIEQDQQGGQQQTDKQAGRMLDPKNLPEGEA
jgi:hypothetical protein